MTRRTFLGETGGAALALAGGARISSTTLRGADASRSGAASTNAAGSGEVLSDEFVLTVGSRTITPRCVSPKGDRLGAAAVIAPVTDWRDLTEFAAEMSQQELADTRLARWAAALAGKRIFMVIGDSDRRVSTLSCCRFFLDLQEAKAGLSRPDSPVEFHTVRMAEPGHTVDDAWRQRGAPGA